MSERKKSARCGADKEDIKFADSVAGAKKLNELIERGRKNGKLTVSDTMELDGIEFDSNTLDRFYRILGSMNVDLVDDEEPVAMSESDADVTGVSQNEADVANITSADDSVRAYLKQIGSIPMLDMDEEIKLAKGKSAGDEASAVLEDAEKEHEGLPSDVVAELKKVVRHGERCRSKLIEANLRLVVSIAKKYVGRGVSLQDLIQEGNAGLINAVDRFDYTKGNKLSTYATWWIRQAVIRAIANTGRTIRVPIHIYDAINKVAIAYRQLLQCLGRTPTPEEIAYEVGMPVNKVCEMLEADNDAMSLETPIGDEEDDAHLEDFIADINAQDPFEALVYTSLKEQIAEVLSTLDHREALVIKMRYGLDGDEPTTLREIGNRMNVSHERVRQLEKRAMERLRMQFRAGKLKDYIA